MTKDQDKEKVAEEKVEKKVDKVVKKNPVKKKKVVKISAKEFAANYGYPKAIAPAVVALESSHREDKTKEDWKVIFDAVMCKPVKRDWKDWLNEFKRRQS